MDTLIVGPVGRSTGGIANYATEQAVRLPDNIRVATHDISTSQGSGPGWFARSIAGALIDAIQYTKRTPPDIIHVHTSHHFSFYRASFYVLFSALVWNRPVVLHIHGSSFDEFVLTDSYILSTFQSLVFSVTCRIVVLSSYWKRILSLCADRTKIVALPNAIDPDEYDPQFDVTKPHLVFISNLIERKGICEIAEAVERLERNTDLPYRLSIAGKGPLSPLVERLAAEYEHVESLGYVTEEEKRTLLNSGSIYLLPSHAEGLPIAILEGMAGGNAIVSTTVGSIPEVIAKENGVLVEPHEPEQLADALASLIADPEGVEQKARTNHGLVREQYSWSVVVDRLVNLYKECLS